MINNHWIRGGCVLAAFFMAVTLFVGAEMAAQVPLFPPPFDKAAHFMGLQPVRTLEETPIQASSGNPAVADSTDPGTKPTMHYGLSRWSAYATTPPPRRLLGTPQNNRGSRTEKSCAVASDIWPGASTRSFSQTSPL